MPVLLNSVKHATHWLLLELPEPFQVWQVQSTEDLLGPHVVAMHPILLLLATVVCKQEITPVATCLNNCCHRVAEPMTTRCPIPLHSCGSLARDLVYGPLSARAAYILGRVGEKALKGCRL